MLKESHRGLIFSCIAANLDRLQQNLDRARTALETQQAELERQTTAARLLQEQLRSLNKAVDDAGDRLSLAEEQHASFQAQLTSLRTMFLDGWGNPSVPGGPNYRNLVNIEAAIADFPRVHDPDMRTYADYLVKRYIKWRKLSLKFDNRKFSPESAHGIPGEGFGSPSTVMMISQGRFLQWIVQAQTKIDRTIWGQNNPHRNYHTWEEHLAQRHGSKSKEDNSGTKS